jgi:peroxiredoxin
MQSLSFFRSKLQTPGYRMPIYGVCPSIGPMSGADEIALAGITAIEAMGGPQIPWQPGRTDYKTAEAAAEHRGTVGDR